MLKWVSVLGLVYGASDNLEILTPSANPKAATSVYGRGGKSFECHQENSLHYKVTY